MAIFLECLPGFLDGLPAAALHHAKSFLIARFLAFFGNLLLRFALLLGRQLGAPPVGLNVLAYRTSAALQESRANAAFLVVSWCAYHLPWKFLLLAEFRMARCSSVKVY